MTGKNRIKRKEPEGSFRSFLQHFHSAREWESSFMGEMDKKCSGIYFLRKSCGRFNGQKNIKKVHKYLIYTKNYKNPLRTGKH